MFVAGMGSVGAREEGVLVRRPELTAALLPWPPSDSSSCRAALTLLSAHRVRDS